MGIEQARQYAETVERSQRCFFGGGEAARSPAYRRAPPIRFSRLWSRLLRK